MARRKHKKIVKRYSSKAEAQAEARRQRAKGHEAYVHYNRSTGEWILEIFVLFAALSIFGALLRRPN